MGKAQLLGFFDVLETMGPKARLSKTRTMSNFEALLCGKGSKEVFERIRNQSDAPSINPSVYLSLYHIYLSVISISLSLRRGSTAA